MAAVAASAAAAAAAAEPVGAWIAADERDTFISWIRGEFAAANAIIDALCSHLQLLSTAPGEYDAVLASILQRRYNWNPVLHMQHYFSIADVLVNLQQVSLKKQAGQAPSTLLPKSCKQDKLPAIVPRMFPGFEEIDGQQVNVMEGLRLYDDVLDSTEASRLAVLVGESHAKKKSRGNKRSPSKSKAREEEPKEMIQFGTIPLEVPAAAPALKEEAVEAMPAFLESVIDHLVKSQIIPTRKRPDTCSISVLDPGGYMPPHNHQHLEHPVFILTLGAACNLAFGRNLKPSSTGEVDAKYRITANVGSVLVLQGRSADMVQCAISPSQHSRILVEFGNMPKAKLPSPPAAEALATKQMPAARSPVYAAPSSPPFVATPAAAAAAVPVTSLQQLVVPSVGLATPFTVVNAWAAPCPAPLSVSCSTTSSSASPSPPPSLAQQQQQQQSAGTGVFIPPTSGSTVYNTQSHHRRHHNNGSSSNYHSHLPAAHNKAVAA